MQCFDIRDFKPNNYNKYLLDTNILLFLYSDLYDPYKDKRLVPYQEFINKRNLKNLYITPLNLSEYENVLRRKKFEDAKDNYKTFKKFRESQEFSEFYEEIISYFELFQQFNIINVNFSQKNFEEYLLLANECIEEGQISFDFNDYLIAKTAEELDLYLITDDKDFVYFNKSLKNLKILTSNDRLLKLCSFYTAKRNK